MLLICSLLTIFAAHFRDHNLREREERKNVHSTKSNQFNFTSLYKIDFSSFPHTHQVREGKSIGMGANFLMDQGLVFVWPGISESC